MDRTFAPLLLLAWVCLLSPLGASAVTISTVPVDNPGNAPDQDYGGLGQFGAVAYAYRIGAYEVTNSQYVQFLNAKDQTGANSLGLYSPFMTSNARGGIDFVAGNAAGAKYSVKTGRGNNPVVYVSWYDAIRFANWLNNGQGAGDTESGAYTLLGGTPEPSNFLTISRNAGATWFLPSENEWYKAAYHQPAAQGGDLDNYWLYPTQTNSTPFSDQPPGSGAPTQSNTANFLADDSIANGYDDGYAVTGSTTSVNSTNYLTDVGAYTQSDSFYGTFDQGGNVYEWTEQLYESTGRYVRGGGWENNANGVSRYLRDVGSPAGDIPVVGFRIANIPEPSSLVLAALGLVMLAAYGRRRWS